MTPSPRRHRPLAALLVAVAVLAAGCGVRGGADPTSSAAGSHRSPRFLLDAAAATSKAGSSRMQVVTEATTGGRTMTVTMDAATDASGRSKLSIDYGDAVPGMGSAEPLTVVLDGSTAYLSGGFISLFTGLGQADRPWLRFDASELDAFGGQQAPGFVSDPAALLDYLKGVSGPITTVGSEPVRGVETSHLRTTLDLGKAIDQAGAEHSAKLKGLLDQMGGTADLPEVPADIWVDADGLVRRLRIAPDLGQESGVDTTVTVEFFGFGDPVDVTVPPADKVQDLGDALPDLGSLLGGN